MRVQDSGTIMSRVIGDRPRWDHGWAGSTQNGHFGPPYHESLRDYVVARLGDRTERSLAAASSDKFWQEELLFSRLSDLDLLRHFIRMITVPAPISDHNMESSGLLMSPLQGLSGDHPSRLGGHGHLGRPSGGPTRHPWAGACQTHNHILGRNVPHL